MLPPPSDRDLDEDTGWFVEHFLARRSAAGARAPLDIVASPRSAAGATGALELDRIAVRVADVGVAPAVVGAAAPQELAARFLDFRDRLVEVRVRRELEAEVIDARARSRVPRERGVTVQCQQVLGTRSLQEHHLWAVAEQLAHAEDFGVEAQRALEIGDVQVQVIETRSADQRGDSSRSPLASHSFESCDRRFWNSSKSSSNDKMISVVRGMSSPESRPR